eukprot:Clim_evm36s88 gene=Clim_evmTU36s88
MKIPLFFSLVTGIVAKLVDLRVLVLGGDVHNMNGVIGEADSSLAYDAVLLEGWGMPHDYKYLDRNNRFDPMDLNLRAADGHARYSAIIWTPSTYEYDDGFYNALPDDKIEEIREYQREFGVRMLELGQPPKTEYLTSPAPDECDDEVIESPFGYDLTVRDCPPIARMTPDGQAINRVLQAYTSLTFTSETTRDGSRPYYVPAIRNDTEDLRTAKAIFTLDPYDKYPNKWNEETILVNYFNEPDTGREVMSSYMSSGWLVSTDIMALNHFLIDWVVKGAFLGSRRIRLSTQVDDVFLRTKSSTEDILYRTSQYDLKRAKEFQDALSTHPKLPAGSDFKMEMAYNHNGMLQAGGISYQFRRDYENESVELPWISDMPCVGWRAPLDTDIGVNIYCYCNGVPYSGPKKNFHGADNIPDHFEDAHVQSWVNNDAVWAYSQSDEVQSWFYWVTHTFSHLELDNVTAFDADAELRLSNRIDWAVGLYDHPYHSSNGLVTPRISGLFNGYALKSMYDNGIRVLVDDKSTGITNDNYPWHGWVTSYERNGFDGMYIMKRDPSEVFFTSTTVQDNEATYEALFGEALGHVENMRREGVRVGLTAMQNFIDANMFHQANLRTRVGDGCTDAVGPDQKEEGCDDITMWDPLFESHNTVHSLLSHWVANVIGGIYPKMSLPLLTARHDEMYKEYLRREDQYYCKPTATVSFDDESGDVRTVLVSAENGTCTIHLTGFLFNTDLHYVDFEPAYGPDSTAILDVPANRGLNIHVSAADTWSWYDPPKVLPLTSVQPSDPLDSWTRSVLLPASETDLQADVENQEDWGDFMIIFGAVLGGVILLAMVVVGVLFRKQSSRKVEHISQVEMVDRI